MTSFIFPGQGSQYPEMSKDFYDNFQVARHTFQEIEDYVEMNLKNIIFENQNEKLNKTNFTQISIFTASIIIFKTFLSETVFEEKQIKVMLGHSLGEYTALACSNKLSLQDCSQILKKRGELMNNTIESNTTGMAALIGKDAKNIQSIIDQKNINLQIANDNSPIQVVLSGEMDELIKNKDLFLNHGVKKYVILNVSAAFHSKYMIEAQNKLSNEIDKLNFNENEVKIISNFNADISSENQKLKSSLKLQMSNQVKWTESIQKLEKTGEREIIEIGPNKILSGLVKRISNNFDIKSINKISDLN